MFADVGPSSVCCPSRGHISKIKQDRPTVFSYYGTLLLSRRSRQRERLHASGLSICSSVRLSVCLSPKYKNVIFSKTKQFRAVVSIGDL